MKFIKATNGAALKTVTIFLFVLCVSQHPVAHADLNRLTFLNDVERAAAAANQATFDILDSACNPEGVYDNTANPEFSDSLVGNGCTEQSFFVFVNTRELVHTANELLRDGPTVASLGLDEEGIRLALRWTAAEEFAAQSSMASDFANGQLSNLASRMSALRFGASGFSLAGTRFNHGDDYLYAYHYQRQKGGGASADEGETYSPWGGFLNGAFGYGSKDPTPLEDAFDFDGSEVTLGVDYRFDNNVVVGAVFGYTEQEVDFNEAASAVSVVDGGIQADGKSALGFIIYQGEKLAISGSLGYQSLDYDVERNIKYPSFNPNIANANSVALSSPKADAILATANMAYAFYVKRFTIEPYLNLEYIDVTIDQFDESRTVNSFSGVQDNRAFDLTISEQGFDSFDGAVGLKLQAVFTPKFAVIVPYVSIEAHKEFQDGARTITAQYANLGALSTSATAFAVPTDPRDSSYTKASAGFSMILRGGRQQEVGGAIAGGLMGFLQFSSIGGREHYDDQVISGGVRYEF